MTIKELREKDAIRLARRLIADPNPEQIEAAKKAMRKFYRFAAANKTSFFVSNDSELYSEKAAAAADRKCEKAEKAAAEALKVYGLKISTPGLYPIIEELNGTNFSNGYYYN